VVKNEKTTGVRRGDVFRVVICNREAIAGKATVVFDPELDSFNWLSYLVVEG
jgi:hypothetical protein